jgi:hypothetical protein
LWTDVVAEPLGGEPLESRVRAGIVSKMLDR